MKTIERKLDKSTLEYIAKQIADVEHKHYVQYIQDRYIPHDVDVGINTAYRQVAGILSSIIMHNTTENNNHEITRTKLRQD